MSQYSVKTKKFALLIVLMMQLVAPQGQAEEDDWGDDSWEEAKSYSLVQKWAYGYSHIIDSTPVNQGSEVMDELDYRLKFDRDFDGYKLNLDLLAKADFLLDDSDLSFHELNLFMPLAQTSELKLGRQVITWGTGDLIFLNDLFPKSWQSFFNGRNDEYLKPPVDALRLSHYGAQVNFELALMPRFQPDEVLTGERYSFYFPEPGSSSPINQPDPHLTLDKPDDSETAARLFKNQQGVEWAVYWYQGYFKTPSHFTEAGQLGFSPMRSLGASIRLPWANGLFNAELAHYHSEDDSSGQNPLHNNSQSRFLLGYETELMANLTLAMQAYWEKTHDYAELLDNLPSVLIAPKENRTLFTTRLTQLALQQKLVNSLMVFVSPSDSDHYVRLQSSYAMTDNFKLAFGLNWLDGKKPHTQFAQMQDNSNLFFRLEYTY